ncbi:hypothetical protein Tco_0458365 [Tanacetum coccineum]
MKPKDAASLHDYGYLFSHESAEILCQAEAVEIRISCLVNSADRDPAGIDSASGVSAGSDPAGGNPAGSFQPAGSYEPAGRGNPAVKEMQQFINQKVWTLVPLPAGKNAIGTKWILKNKRDARGIVVAIIEAIRLFLAFASYMGFLVYQLDVKSAFSMEKIEEDVFMSLSLKALKILSSQSMCTEWLKLCMDFIKHLEPGMQDCLLFCYNTITEEVLIEKENFEMKCYGRVEFLLRSSRSMIGSLMYLTASRPDIMFAVSACSRHQVTPLTSHLNAVQEDFQKVNFMSYARSILLWLLLQQEAELLLLSVCSVTGTLDSEPVVDDGFNFYENKFVIGTTEHHCALWIWCFVGYYFLVIAGCVFLLFAWFLLLVDSFCWLNTFMLLNCFCCAQFDIAGWLVSATSHLVSAGSLQSCWYALTHDPPVVFDSLVKQFWATAVVRPNAAGSHDLVATIDGREVVVTESLIRTQLQFDDANGIFDMPINDIIGGYEGWDDWESLRVSHTVDNPMLAIVLLAMMLLNGLSLTLSHLLLTGDHGLMFLYILPLGMTFIFEEPLVFGPEPRPAGPDTYLELEDLDNIISMEDDTTHDGFHVDLTGVWDVLTPWKLSWKVKGRIMGGAILTLVSRVKKLEKTVKQLRETRLVVEASAAEGDVDIQDDIDLDGLSRMASTALGHDQPAVPSEDVEEREEEEFQANLSAGVLPVPEPAGPSVTADKGKAPMPDLDIPAEFLAEDAQARKCFEEEQASERLVQRLRAEDLAQEDLPHVSEERAKELDDLMMRMTETDWLNLMLQVGSNPALARELLGADVNEANFIERMNAVKEKKKRPRAVLRYRALKGKPLKKSEVTQMMRNLVKNQCCAAHNGTITMKDPAITEPPSKRQRVERVSSQPASVPAATTLPADDPDSAGVLTLLSLLLGPSPFLSSIAGGINEFFLESDEEEQIGIYELLFLMMRFVDPRVKVETVSVSASSPPRSRRKHLGVRSDDFLWDKPVENRRRKYFTYLKELLPHVYHEDLLLLRRRMNRYFRLNPEVDVGLDLWRDVNLLCQSLHPDDVRRTFGVHKMNGLWVARSYILRVCSCPGFDEWEDCHSSPLYCRDVVVAGNIIQYGIGWYKGKQMSVLILLLCKVVSELDMVLNNFGGRLALPTNGFQLTMANSQERVWLTIANGFGVYLKSVDGCQTFSNPLIVDIYLKIYGLSTSPYYSVYEELASPEQTATGKDMLNPLYGCDGLPKTVRVLQFTLDSRSEKLDWLLLHQGLLFFDVATLFDSVFHRVHAVSFDAAVLDVASTVSAACIVAAGYIVSAGICDAAGSFVLAVFILFAVTLFLLLPQSSCFREESILNLELTESKPMVSAGSSSSVSAGYIIEFMLEDLEAVPADYVPADLIYRRDYCMQEL